MVTRNHIGVFPVTLLLFSLPGFCYGEVLFLSLEEVLRRAEENSIELQASEAAALLARSAYIFDLRDFFPTFSLSYSGNRSVTIGGADSGKKQIALQISQPLFNGGRSVAERLLNKEKLKIQQQTQKEVQISIREQAWEAFQEIAMMREQYRLQEKSVQLTRDLMNIISLKRSQGSITELEYLQGEIKLQETLRALQETELDLRLKEFTFLLLLGLPPDSVFRLAGESFISYAGMDIPIAGDQLFRIACIRNTDIQNSSFAVHQQELINRLNRFRSLPAVSLEGGITVSGEEFPLSSLQYSLSVSFSMPGAISPIGISTGLTTSDETRRTKTTSLTISPLEDFDSIITGKQNRTKAKTMRKQHDRLVQELKYSLGEALHRHLLLKGQLRLHRKTLELLKREYELLVLRWTLGEARHSQVLEAHTGLAAKEIELLMKILEIKLAERDIERLAGLAPGDLLRIVEGVYR